MGTVEEQLYRCRRENMKLRKDTSKFIAVLIAKLGGSVGIGIKDLVEIETRTVA